MADRDAGRLYRFAPLDRTGWILGMSAPQCGLIGVTIFAASLAAQADAAPLVLLVIIVAGLNLAYFSVVACRPSMVPKKSCDRRGVALDN